MFHYSSSSLYYPNRQEEQKTATISYNHPGQIKNPFCYNLNDNNEDCLNDLKYESTEIFEQHASYSPPDQKTNSIAEVDQLNSEEVAWGNGIIRGSEQFPADEDPLKKNGEPLAETSAVHESNGNPGENNIVGTPEKEINVGTIILVETKTANIYNHYEDSDPQALYQVPELEEGDIIMPSAQQVTGVEPCEGCSGLKVEFEMQIQNKIQPLEDRILQLESQVKILLDNHKRLAPPETIALDGSMIISCGCGCAK